MYCLLLIFLTGCIWTIICYKQNEIPAAANQYRDVYPTTADVRPQCVKRVLDVQRKVNFTLIFSIDIWLSLQTSFHWQKQSWDCFVRKGVLRNLAKFTGKHLGKTFSCEFCEISQNTFFIEPFRANASTLVYVISYDEIFKSNSRKRIKNIFHWKVLQASIPYITEAVAQRCSVKRCS